VPDLKGSRTLPKNFGFDFFSFLLTGEKGARPALPMGGRVFPLQLIVFSNRGLSFPPAPAERLSRRFLLPLNILMLWRPLGADSCSV
jgi:hypothetical protein